MKSSVTNMLMALGLVAVGVGIAAADIFIGEMDDAPGAAIIGILQMLGAVVLSVRIARRRHNCYFQAKYWSSIASAQAQIVLPLEAYPC